MASSPRPQAFTLIELLIVIAIIAVLTFVLTAATGQVRERSKSFHCVANLRQIGAATMQYVGEHNGELPYYYYVTKEGGTGSGAATGAWYYNLAPYIGVPRTEIPNNAANTERTKLGTAEQRITAPCVFTCPAHRKTETNLLWAPEPMTWPADKPVSYAPPLEARGNNPYKMPIRAAAHPAGIDYYPIRFTDILYPSKKIWISDSPRSDCFNSSENRWAADNGSAQNWARQGFERHHEGGNALFYDGHVEWLPLTTFTNPPGSTTYSTARRYFNPYRDPAIDP